MSRQPITAISESEFKAFVDYIREYSGDTAEVGADYLLREWDQQKQRIFDIFGEKLIVKYPVEVVQSREAIAKDIDDAWGCNMPKLAQNFANKFINFCAMKRSELWDQWRACVTHGEDREELFPEKEVKSFYDAEGLLDTIALANNSVSNDFYIDLPKPDGSVRHYHVQEGAKPLRVIRAIIKAFGENEVATYEELDAFATWHSQFLNTYKVSGNLCFSIHPLDYLTMSDNENDWSSCMSWRDSGCYRAGTVEMMNSPYAVVVYLESDKTYTMPGPFEWNSKRWRTLLLVHPELGILSVKSYPYYHEDLTRIAIEKLVKMDSQNSYLPVDKFKPFDNHQIVSGVSFASITPTVYRMYNDFGSTTHFMAPLASLLEGEDHIFRFQYSGMSECMKCGCLFDRDTDGFSCFTSEEELLCVECGGYGEDYVHCEECGDIVHTDDINWVDETPLCNRCFDRLAYYDELIEEACWLCDSVMVFFKYQGETFEIGRCDTNLMIIDRIKSAYEQDLLDEARESGEMTVEPEMLTDVGINLFTWWLRYRSGRNWENREYDLRGYLIKSA